MAKVTVKRGKTERKRRGKGEERERKGKGKEKEKLKGREEEREREEKAMECDGQRRAMGRVPGVGGRSCGSGRRRGSRTSLFDLFHYIGGVIV